MKLTIYITLICLTLSHGQSLAPELTNNSIELDGESIVETIKETPLINKDNQSDAKKEKTISLVINDWIKSETIDSQLNYDNITSQLLKTMETESTTVKVTSTDESTFNVIPKEGVVSTIKSTANDQMIDEIKSQDEKTNESNNGIIDTESNEQEREQQLTTTINFEPEVGTMDKIELENDSNSATSTINDEIEKSTEKIEERNDDSIFQFISEPETHGTNESIESEIGQHFNIATDLPTIEATERIEISTGSFQFVTEKSATTIGYREEISTEKKLPANDDSIFQFIPETESHSIASNVDSGIETTESIESVTEEQVITTIKSEIETSTNKIETKTEKYLTTIIESTTQRIESETESHLNITTFKDEIEIETTEKIEPFTEQSTTTVEHEQENENTERIELQTETEFTTINSEIEITATEMIEPVTEGQLIKTEFSTSTQRIEPETELNLPSSTIDPLIEQHNLTTEKIVLLTDEKEFTTIQSEIKTSTQIIESNLDTTTIKDEIETTTMRNKGEIVTTEMIETVTDTIITVIPETTTPNIEPETESHLTTSKIIPEIETTTQMVEPKTESPLSTTMIDPVIETTTEVIKPVTEKSTTIKLEPETTTQMLEPQTEPHFTSTIIPEIEMTTQVIEPETESHLTTSTIKPETETTTKKQITTTIKIEPEITTTPKVESETEKQKTTTISSEIDLTTIKHEEENISCDCDNLNTNDKSDCELICSSSSLLSSLQIKLTFFGVKIAKILSNRDYLICILSALGILIVIAGFTLRLIHQRRQRKLIAQRNFDMLYQDFGVANEKNKQWLADFKYQSSIL